MTLSTVEDVCAYDEMAKYSSFDLGLTIRVHDV